MRIPRSPGSADMSASVRLRDGVLAQTTLAHAVLLDSASGAYFELNPVGTRIVRCLIDGDRNDAIIDAIVAGFAVEPALASSDVQAFIDDLLQRGLLVPVDD